MRNMAWSRSNLMVITLMLLSASTAFGGALYDVTTYGAKPNGDVTQGLVKAWTEACASTNGPSKIVIPKGTYDLLETNFKGPCKGAIELNLQGTVTAPASPRGEAWVIFSYLDQLTLSGNGVFDGQGKQGWAKNNCNKNKNCAQLPINLRFDYVTNSAVTGITSLDSKNFHVNVLGCKNLTFQHVTITAPGDSPNTDGIHIGRSDGVKILNTNIATGDDCISLGDGSKQITISDVTCGPGHGISIGSLGKYGNEEPVEGVIVKNSKLTGTTNGVRIKSWPASPAEGIASDMHFEGIEMVNVSNPILIDQEYCPWNQCNRQIPSKVKISKVSFKNIRGTSATKSAVTLVCSKSFPCEGVEIADISLSYNGKDGPITSQCAFVNPQISGVQNPRACTEVAVTGGPSTD